MITKEGFQEWSTLRTSKDGKGTKLILKPTETGEVIFQMAKQNGTIKNGPQTLPTFDYKNSSFFGFADIEMAKIVRTIEKQFINYSLSTEELVPELVFPHMNSKAPKTIKFAFTIYNGKLQCTLSCLFSEGAGTNMTIYLNEEEIECIKEICRTQYTFSSSRILNEYFDNLKFKAAVMETLYQITEKLGVDNE